MQLRHLLDHKGRDVYSVRSGASVREAVELLAKRNVGALVVTSPSGGLEGILSERDVARRLFEDDTGVLEKRVADVMTPVVTTCTSVTSVTEVMALMTEERIRHVPVVDGGHLVGLVSIGDVVRSRIEELENDRRDLLEYVGAR